MTAVITLQWQANIDLFKHFLQIIEIEEQCVELTSWTALYTPSPLLQVKNSGLLFLRARHLETDKPNKGIAT